MSASSPSPGPTPRSRLRRSLRPLAYAAATTGVVLALAVAWLYATTGSRLSRVYAVADRRLAIPVSAAAVERGRHLARIYMCHECHGEDLGGRVFADIPLTAYLPAPNLTRGRGGIAARYQPEDWAWAIFDGVRRDGRPLVFMPSHELRHMTGEDLGAIVAFITQAPPVAREWPRARVKLLGRVMMIATSQTVLPAERIAGETLAGPPPAPAVSVAYGEHLATTAGCRSCHRRDLSGGAGPPPGGANLTREGDVAGWQEADFVRTIRTGRRPDGSQLAAGMPRGYAEMSDLELSALWLYLQSVPPVPRTANGARERR